MAYKSFTPYIAPTLKSKFFDILLNTGLRHIAKRIIIGIDRSLTFMDKDLEATTMRCTKCYRLCRFNFDSVLTSCRTLSDSLLIKEK